MRTRFCIVRRQSFWCSFWNYYFPDLLSDNHYEWRASFKKSNQNENKCLKSR